jgi:hypothetical protein
VEVLLNKDLNLFEGNLTNVFSEQGSDVINGNKCTAYGGLL